MSSLIEQAAQRLQQLRQAGVSLGDDVAPPTAAATAAPQVVPPPGALARTPVAPPPALSRAAPTSASLETPEPAGSGFASRLIELDFATLAAAGIVTPDSPRSHVADQYRVIKRPLISNAKGKGASILNHGNLIMVTSALAGEGKTFTAINLAISIAAELDNTVMLVDADVARPSVLRTLGLPAAPGLLDLLEGKCQMRDVLFRTNINKLSILPSGTPQGRATELLASGAMRLLLDDMANRYPDRIIVFDSPPLLLTTESRVLATQMGQVVMVVQAERTLQSDVQHALSTIDSCPVRLLLLNQASASGSGGYGYGYGYGHGYGYGYGQDAAASSQAT